MAKKKGIKISKVKRVNHLRNKLGRRKTNKANSHFYINRHKSTVIKTPELQKEEEEYLAEDMLEMMENEDVEFLQDAVTAQSYELLKKLRIPLKRDRKRCQNVKSTQKSDEFDDTCERLYEQDMDQPDSKRTKLLLPIKTKEGIIMRSTEIDPEIEAKEKLEREIQDQEKIDEIKRKKKEKRDRKKKKKKGDTAEANEEEKCDDVDLEEEEEEEEGEEVNTDNLNGLEKEYEQLLPQSVATVDLLACRDELLRKRKFQIGVLSAGLLETPEMKVGNFKYLLEILDKDYSEVKLTVRKIAALSLMEVFGDLLPLYKIKHSETNSGVKLKKKTEILVNYEKGLLKAYKMFLQSLERMTKALRRKRGDTRVYDPVSQRLGIVALRCLTELLIRRPYFNFSLNIGQALVQFLDIANPDAREIATKGLQNVLKEDKRGELSLHIVRRINHLVRVKNHSVRPEVISVLMALRLRNVNLDAEREAELKEKKLLSQKKKIMNMSKRERKRQKRIEELEKEMLETKAEESKQTKQKCLTEITKYVFTIIFRVLKCAPSSKLLSVTLEGLSKFAHCINLEFFQDLVNVLDNLLLNSNLGVAEKLHCVETVFTILSGQGEALNIDPLRFYTHLYNCLPEVLGSSPYAHSLIVVRNLEKALIARKRKVTLQRLMAFVKRLCSFVPYLIHGAALGYLAVVLSILTQVRSCDILLDTDASYGDGIYQPELPEPEYCSAGSSTLWELTTLIRHYHPEVQRMAQCIMKSDERLLSPEVAKLSPHQMVETYDCSEMVFRPAVPPPRKVAPRAHLGRLVLTDDEFALHVQNVEKSVSNDCLKDWKISLDSFDS